MSIQKVAYQFCKAIQKSSNREQIKNFMNAMRFDNDTGFFRQLARDVSKYPKIQFLSYLIINQDREKLEKQVRHPIAILDQDEIRLLANCHEQMLKLNEKLLAPLTEKIPNSKLSLSPYSIPIYNQFYNQQECDIDFELFADNFANDLIAEFHKHSAIKLAIETFEKLDEEIDENHYFNDVASLSNQLYEATPFGSPQWLPTPPSNSHTKHLKHMLALVSIRDSLANLNQLIFQALVEIDDKLIMMDENNIIDLSPTFRTESGWAVSITCQTSEDIKFLFGIEPIDFNAGYLVLLKEVYGYEETQLGRVEASRSSLFSDYDIAKFNIRLIDENLNSFPYILELEEYN